MSSYGRDSDVIRSYLLDELSEQEREQVEQSLMTDDDLYQRLLLTEDDLIDEYVSGSLSDRDQAKFKRRFLQAPELLQDVRSVKALRKHALETMPRVSVDHSPVAPPVSLFDWLRKFFMRPAVGIAFATVLLAAVPAVVWLAAQNLQLRKEVEQLQARQQPQSTPQQGLREELAAERLRNEQLSAELKREQQLAEESQKFQQSQEQHPPSPTLKPDSGSGLRAVFAFTLGTGAVRESGELKKVTVPHGAREVRIRLDLAATDYRSYRAVLQTAEGREVLSSQGLRASGGIFVQLRIPAKLLTPGDYQIRLSGIRPSREAEEIDNYYFRVLR